MSTIDDLKNDGNNESVKDPFIPSIEQESEPFVPGVVQGNSVSSTVPTKKNSFSMVSGKPTKNTENTEMSQRVKADFSHLPKNNYDGAGTDTKESIEQEILGPGGEFESYLDKRKKEYQEYVEQYDLEQELKGTTENSVSEEKNDEDDIESEIEKELSNSNITFKERNISFDEEEEKTMNNIEQKDLVTEDSFEELDEDLSEDTEYNQSYDSISGRSFTDDEDNESEVTEDIEVKRDTVKIDDSNILSDDELEISDDEIENETLDEEKRLEILRKMITERIKPVSQKIDISSFTIAKKGISSSNIFNMNEVPTAKWALPTTGIVVDMKEISGADLDKLRTAGNRGDARLVLQIIYNNIVSAKPDSFEVWMKSIAYEDYDHLFMAIYAAAFADSNYIPGDCENKSCKEKNYITDNISIMDMVNFKDDKAKERFKRLMKECPTNKSGSFVTEVVPVSDKFAIGFKIPTLYSVFIESNYIDDAFAEKYSNMVTFLPYIDNIYKIDMVNHQLTPIEYKKYPENAAKTVKSKVIFYNKALSTMSIDEITIVRAYINKINEHSSDITYRIPETTCPHCGHVNPAQENQTAASLVFLRNQLALLVTT